MSNLLPELITDILCRLPVKSLLRFRCVSKPWCSQIGDPYFIKLQLSHSLKTNTNLNLILKDNDNDLFSVGLDGIEKAVKLNNPKHDDDYGTEVLGCCNGLLALALYNHFDDIALWNPYTSNYLELPFMGVEILRENCRSEFGFGFGYDPITDDYKFVWLVQFCHKDTDSFDSVVKVYSLKAASWTRIPDFPYYIRNNGDCGVLANDALHWVVTRKRESDTRNLIAGFDLGAGEYFEVPQPDNVFKFNVGVLGGCLCVCCNSVQVRVDIWVMKEYRVKESWTKLFSVAQQEVTGVLKFFRPLAYSKSGDKVLLHQGNQNFVWYDLRRKTADKVRIQGVPKLFEAEMCVASLVPLGGQARIKKKNKNKNSGKKRKR